eukprot:scaffold870_cov268-Pinguiococcus_pyrenoidosus.AAC.56
MSADILRGPCDCAADDAETENGIDGMDVAGSTPSRLEWSAHSNDDVYALCDWPELHSDCDSPKQSWASYEIAAI